MPRLALVSMGWLPRRLVGGGGGSGGDIGVEEDDEVEVEGDGEVVRGEEKLEKSSLPWVEEA